MFFNSKLKLAFENVTDKTFSCLFANPEDLIEETISLRGKIWHQRLRFSQASTGELFKKAEEKREKAPGRCHFGGFYTLLF